MQNIMASVNTIDGMLGLIVPFIVGKIGLPYVIEFPNGKIIGPQTLEEFCVGYAVLFLILSLTQALANGLRLTSQSNRFKKQNELSIGTLLVFSIGLISLIISAFSGIFSGFILFAAMIVLWISFALWMFAYKSLKA